MDDRCVDAVSREQAAPRQNQKRTSMAGQLTTVELLLLGVIYAALMFLGRLFEPYVGAWAYIPGWSIIALFVLFVPLQRVIFSAIAGKASNSLLIGCGDLICNGSRALGARTSQTWLRGTVSV
jgi:hypothetical protein